MWESARAHVQSIGGDGEERWRKQQQKCKESNWWQWHRVEKPSENIAGNQFKCVDSLTHLQIPSIKCVCVCLLFLTDLWWMSEWVSEWAKCVFDSIWHLLFCQHLATPLTITTAQLNANLMRPICFKLESGKKIPLKSVQFYVRHTELGALLCFRRLNGICIVSFRRDIITHCPVHSPFVRITVCTNSCSSDNSNDGNDSSEENENTHKGYYNVQTM